jgi:N-acetylneuraminic acid mutarotase
MLVGAVAGIVFGGGSAKADFIWTQKADMPTGRWTQTSAVVNGKIYVIGGYPSEGTPGEAALSVVEEYDPATNTWTRKADMPTARCDFVGSSAVVDGKIYVISGWDDGSRLSIVEEYDPATDTWTRKADMPTRRWMLATVAVEGKIYVIGGYSPSAWVGLKTVEMYDPETDTWTRKADMPLGVGLLNARVVNGKIYAIGGRPDLKSRAYLQEYDPATDTWTRKADMPVGTSQMGSVVIGDKIVVIGGWIWSVQMPHIAVQMYNPATDTWTREPDVPFFRACFSAELVNNKIYAIGGTDKPHPCLALSTVYEFGPLLDFNSDGIIDSKDVCIMIEYWGTDEPLCDIAPPPSGDGIVDVSDLTVLGEHLFEDFEVVPPALPPSFGSFTEDPPGTYTMTDRGVDIWDPLDQFHFAYMILSGPGSIEARVDSLTNTNMWAKAGVMIRETLDCGSKHAFVCVTPGQGVAFEGRTYTDGASFNTNQTGITAPHWVKLERDSTGRFTAFHSNGAMRLSRDGTQSRDWQPIAGARNIPMNTDVYIGLALTSHNALETCQAVFSNVTIMGDILPQWSNQDVGPLGQP